MKLTIDIAWWDDLDGYQKIPHGLEVKLRDSAVSRAAELIKEGYSEGELSYTCVDGMYRGHWRVTRLERD